MQLKFTSLKINTLALVLLQTLFSITAVAQLPGVVPKPTTASSNIVFTAFTETSLTLTWTSGNGSNRIVVAREEAIVDSLPKDGQNYTASTTFGQGSNLGNGQFVLFNGSGNTVSVIGLNPEKIYHFAIFEYNGNNNLTSYLSTNKATGNRSTLATEPTLNVTDISFVAVDLTTLSLSFTNGNGTGRLVIAKKGAATSLEPAEGANYTANTNFGNGSDLGGGNFVVYSGTDKNVTIAGLTPGTAYHFAIYEFNGSSAESINYLKSNVAKANQETRFNEPSTSATNLVISAISESALLVNFNKGNGTNRIVIARATNPINQQLVDGSSYTANNTFFSGTDLGGGNYVVYAGNGTSFQLNGLNANSTYHLSVIEFNGSGASSNYFNNGILSGSKGTLAPEPTLTGGAFQFIATSANTIRVTLSSGNGNERLVVVREANAVNQFPTDGVNYTADSTFSNGDQVVAGSGNYVVYKGKDKAFTLKGLAANTLYHFAVFEYNGTVVSGNNNTLNYLTAGAIIGKQATLDIEPTVAAKELAFSNIAGNSITVSWKNGTGNARILVARAGDIQQIPNDGTEYTANDVFGNGSTIGSGAFVVYSGTGSSVDVKGLTANTTYYFAVFEFSGTNTANNYKTDIDNTSKGSQSTFIAKPTAAATNLTLSPITNGTASLSWNKGNGGKRVLIVKEGFPITKFPDDGSDYLASDSFGVASANIGLGHFACYDGNGSSAILRGLSVEKAYYFALFEYNGTDTATSYLTATFATTNNLPAEPQQVATNFVFKNLTAESVKISWTNGNGAYRVLYVKEGSPVNKIPVDGQIYVATDTIGKGVDLGFANYIVYNGTSNTVDLKGLKNSTLYHFALYEYNQDIEGPANYSNKPLTGSKSNVVLSIGKNKADLLLLYPNPTTDAVNIRVNEYLKDATLFIYNQLGQLVFSEQITNLSPTDTYSLRPSLAKGQYHLSIISTNKSYAAPLTVN